MSCSLSLELVCEFKHEASTLRVRLVVGNRPEGWKEKSEGEKCFPTHIVISLLLHCTKIRFVGHRHPCWVKRKEGLRRDFIVPESSQDGKSSTGGQRTERRCRGKCMGRRKAIVKLNTGRCTCSHGMP
jgi:hypothetical protein